MVQVLDFCGLLFLFVAACHTYKDYLRAHLLGLHTTQTMLRLTNGDMGFLSHLAPLASRREMRKGEAAPGERKMKAQYFSKGMKSIRTPKF